MWLQESVINYKVNYAHMCGENMTDIGTLKETRVNDKSL